MVFPTRPRTLLAVRLAARGRRLRWLGADSHLRLQCELELGFATSQRSQYSGLWAIAAG